MKPIGIALFDGFGLPDIARIVESFQRANDISEFGERGPARFSVRLLSTVGGRVASSSAVFVWTETIGVDRKADGFHALFIAGGIGVAQAARDEELIGWLREICPLTKHVCPVGEGRMLLDVAGSESSSPAHLPGLALNPVHAALDLIESELGRDAMRRVTTALEPAKPNEFTDQIHRNASGALSEPIQTSARWLEENGHRAVGIDEAARVATMSERHFLRRFKAELGVTPSDYLMYVRLDMSCRLLVQTTLPVDKIARRCGIGSGGRLAKLFRKHLGKTPTAYRAHHRTAAGRRD
ncbi:MAG: HTH-type transcriptional regulator [Burkholderia plantarii]|nr:MAG: HTH-type transcriptional regulator [Burkholderia plantarii]